MVRFLNYLYVDIYTYMNTDTGAIKLNKPTTFMYVRFYGGKLTHVIYRFIVPLYFMPIWKMVGNG